MGTAIPIPVVGTLLGGILGSFIGDLLYDIIVKKDPGAALKKVQDAAKKIFETGKAVFDWLKGGFGRFIESFKEKNQIGIGFAKTVNWLALLDLTKTLPLLKDSFFPPQATRRHQTWVISQVETLKERLLLVDLVPQFNHKLQ